MLNKKVEDFSLQAYYNSNINTIKLSDYASKYIVLLFYPCDFSFVCPSELKSYSDYKPEFEKINTQLFMISCDSALAHQAWANIEPEKGGIKDVNLPILSDIKREVTNSLGLFNKETGVSYRATVILDKEHVVKNFSVYSDNMGRNVEETLRIVQNMKMLDENEGRMFCPVNYKVTKK